MSDSRVRELIRSRRYFSYISWSYVLPPFYFSPEEYSYIAEYAKLNGWSKNYIGWYVVPV